MHIRKEMITNAMAHNPALTKKCLFSKSYVEILRNCHPLFRPGFARRLYVSGKISKGEAHEFFETS